MPNKWTTFQAREETPTEYAAVFIGVIGFVLEFTSVFISSPALAIFGFSMIYIAYQEMNSVAKELGPEFKYKQES